MGAWIMRTARQHSRCSKQINQLFFCQQTFLQEALISQKSNVSYSMILQARQQNMFTGIISSGCCIFLVACIHINIVARKSCSEFVSLSCYSINICSHDLWSMCICGHLAFSQLFLYFLMVYNYMLGSWWEIAMYMINWSAVMLFFSSLWIMIDVVIKCLVRLVDVPDLID